MPHLWTMWQYIYESDDISTEIVSETECNPDRVTEEGILNLFTTCLENLKSQLFAMGVAVDS